jgi:mono/diheme cytochrome c family protein
MIQLRVNGTTQSINGAPEESKPISEGRAMTQDKTQHHVTLASGVLLLFFVALALFVVSIVRAAPGPDSVASAAAFRTKCVMCHGPDGSGSAIGKSMNVPDLRSPAVQKLPNAQLAQIISDGKGAMPSFKSSLSEDQIHSLATYVRSLRPKK